MRGLSRMPSEPNLIAVLPAKIAIEETGTSSKEMKAVSKYLATIGQRGGIKGGKARAAALSSERRSEIARRAAQSRWKRI